MSVTLGDAVLWLRTDDSKLNAGLQKAEGNVMGAIGRFGTFAAVGVGGALVAAAGAATGFAAATIKGNAQFETYLTQFGVLLGSADEAKKRLDDLAVFGAKTPFELPQVVEADKILQGFGLHAEDAQDKFGYAGEEIRRIAGDVASGTGASFSEMALLIGKMSTGATGEAIARMAELGIASKTDLAAMGLEFSKSGQLMSPLPQAMSTVLKLMNDKYGGMMDAQSATFDGMVSNVQDWVAGTIREAGRPIFDAARENLGKLLEVMNGEGMQFAIKSISEFFTAMLTGGEDPIGDLINVVYGLGQAFGLAPEQIRPVQDAIREMGTFIQDTALPAISAFGAEFSKFINEVVLPFVTTHKEEIIAALTAIGALLAGALIVSGIMGIAGAILALANPITLIIVAAGLLGAAWAGNWGGIREKTAAVVAFLQPLIAGFLNAVTGFWTQNGASIMATVGAIWAFLKAGFGNVFNDLKAVFELFSLAFSGKWTEFGAKLRSIFDSKMEETKEVWKKLQAWFLSVDWGAVGKAILEGIAQGMNSAWSFIQDAAKAAAQAALDAAKGFLGIHSPSDKWDEEIGEPSAEGAAIGFTRRMGQLGASMGAAQIGSVSSLGVSSLAMPAPVMASVQVDSFISTADRYEAERLLLPIIENILRKLGYIKK